MDNPSYDDFTQQINNNTSAQQGNLLSTQNRQLEYQMEDAEKNLAEAQLDVEETLTKINHLLKQDSLVINEERNVLEWKKIDDEKKRVLTDEGVEKLMQVIQSYINKETLLSNFDDKMINRRMLEFCLALNGLLFLKYEVYFRTPSVEECQEILKERINNQVKTKRMSLQILDKSINEKEIRNKILDEIEPRIEYEIQKIKEDKVKLNLREFEMIFVQLKALVEATHNRAWRGEERGSLRRHFNISEVIGTRPQQMPEKKKGWFGL